MKLVHRLEEGEEVKPQGTSQVDSPKKRPAVITSTTNIEENTIER